MVQDQQPSNSICKPLSVITCATEANLNHSICTKSKFHGMQLRNQRNNLQYRSVQLQAQNFTAAPRY